ncbi:MAG TPA: DUF1592 domain-containing protein [Sphingobium sp.]|uniref:DUF1592 domain-containing protein n=1 Tax=Sphingobium sp. TaxID=1912891 RepID=UPI002ED0EE17
MTSISRTSKSTRLVSAALIIGAVGSLMVAAVGVGATDGASAPEPVSMGGPATFRRLSEEQYKRSIGQIFGPEIQVGGRFEPEVREDGLLAIGSSKVVVTPGGFEQYAIRSREISAQVLDEKNRGKYLGCTPAKPSAYDEACGGQFLGKYGRLLFRRPLSDAEKSAVVGLSRKEAQASGNFYKGVGAGLAWLLNSPSFVFRMERTEADPSHPGARRLDSYSLATRISFLLWDAPPDQELLDVAANGGLHTPQGLQKQVDRMLASPRLEQGVRAFFSDMLAFDQFAGLSKDSALYPIFNPQLRDDAEEQSLRTITYHLLTEDGDYRDLFTTKKTFLSRSLGALYGVPVDARAFGGWMPYSFPANDPHAGLLTLPAFLMLDPSHEGRSSPTIRGKTARENMLCQMVPPPPANVNFDLVQDVNDPVHKTARERLMAHQENPVCAGCHRITDPIGLSLENYNAVGSFRTHENGVVIDASGKFDGKPYNNAIELTKILRDSPSIPACVVQRTYEYGVGRKVTASEEQWLDYQNNRFAADGYKFPALLRRIATSPAFQAVSSTNIALK